MATLEEEFKKYLEKENQYKVQKGVFNNSLVSTKSEIKSLLEVTDLSVFDEYGIDFDLDLDKLDDSEYCKTKVKEIVDIMSKLESIGRDLLK